MHMKFCEVGVFHHDCWFTSAISAFPGIKLSELSSRAYDTKSGDRVVKAGYMVSSCKPEEIKNLVKHISSSGQVVDAKPVYTDTGALVLVSWKAHLTSYDAILNSGCSYSSSVYSRNGFETYSLLTEKPNTLKKVLDELEQIGEVKIFSVKNTLSEGVDRFGLTQKQRDALVSAISSGYYDWPKKVNLEALAGKLGRKRRALQENLRKAEGKVFPRLLDELSKY